MQLIASANHVLNVKIAFIIFHVHLLKRLICVYIYNVNICIGSLWTPCAGRWRHILFTLVSLVPSLFGRPRAPQPSHTKIIIYGVLLHECRMQIVYGGALRTAQSHFILIIIIGQGDA